MSNKNLVYSRPTQNQTYSQVSQEEISQKQQYGSLYNSSPLVKGDIGELSQTKKIAQSQQINKYTNSQSEQPLVDVIQEITVFTELERLSQEFSAKEKEVEYWRNRYGKLEKQYKLVLDQLKSQFIDKKKRDLVNEHSKIDSKELTQIKNKLKDLETYLGLLEQENEKLNQENQAFQHKITSMSEKDQLETKINILTLENEKQKQQIQFLSINQESNSTKKENNLIEQIQCKMVLTGAEVERLNLILKQTLEQKCKQEQDLENKIEIYSQEKQSLTQILKDYQLKIDDMYSEIEQYKTNMDSLQKHYQQQIEELNIKNKNSFDKELKSISVKNNQQIDNLNDKLLQQLQLIQEYEQEKNIFQVKINNQQQEIDQLNINIIQLQQYNQEFQYRLGSFAQENQNLQKIIQAKVNEIEVLNKQLEEKLNQQKYQEEQILQENILENKNILLLKIENERLHSVITELEQQRYKFIQLQKQYDIELQQLSKDSKSSQFHYKTIKEMEDIHQKEKEELFGDIKICRAKINDQQMQIITLQESINKQEQLYKQLQGKVFQSEQSLNNDGKYQKIIDSLESKILKLTVEKQKLQSNVDTQKNYQTQIEQNQKQLKLLENRILSLEEENLNLSSVKQDLDQYRKQFLDLQKYHAQQIEQLKLQLQKSKQNDLQVKLTQLQQQNQLLNNELMKTKQSITLQQKQQYIEQVTSGHLEQKTIFDKENQQCINMILLQCEIERLHLIINEEVCVKQSRVNRSASTLSPNNNSPIIGKITSPIKSRNEVPRTNYIFRK